MIIHRTNTMCTRMTFVIWTKHFHYIHSNNQSLVDSIYCINHSYRTLSNLFYFIVCLTCNSNAIDDVLSLCQCFALTHFVYALLLVINSLTVNSFSRLLPFSSLSRFTQSVFFVCVCAFVLELVCEQSISLYSLLLFV